MKDSKRSQDIFRFLMLVGILLFINVIAHYFYSHLDLTEEKRFTLTKPTKALLGSVKDRIFVRVLLEGDFPAGFKRLQVASKDILQDFRSENGLIEYVFENPSLGTKEEINERRKALSEVGINPINLKVMEQGETTQKLVYPVAIFNYGNRSIPVKLLENETPGFSNEQILNNSVALLEYKFANTIKKLQSPYRPIILFTKGHGELNDLQLGDILQNLATFYEPGRIDLDSVLSLSPKDCALLVIAKPRGAFSEKTKFNIDQYIMNGGKALWLVDELNAELDSLGTTGTFIPTNYPLNIEDMLFKYGVRIQPDMVLDMQCSKIPLATGQLGNAPQMELFNWYYYPTVTPKSTHPVVKNLDRVEFKFASSIDTIETRKAPVKKTILLQSSQYSRVQFSPVQIGFDILRYDPDPSKFNKGNKNLAVLLEGNFTSNYEGRITDEMNRGLQQLGLQFRGTSTPEAKMLVISDGDVIASTVRDYEKKSWFPMGYNRAENVTYANKDFILNAIEYMCESSGVMEARTKEVKLRLLDGVRTRQEAGTWRAINIGIPLALLAAFGLFFQWRRKRKYSTPKG